MHILQTVPKMHANPSHCINKCKSEESLCSRNVEMPAGYKLCIVVIIWAPAAATDELQCSSACSRGADCAKYQRSTKRWMSSALGVRRRPGRVKWCLWCLCGRERSPGLCSQTNVYLRVGAAFRVCCFCCRLCDAIFLFGLRKGRRQW